MTSRGMLVASGRMLAVRTHSSSGSMQHGSGSPTVSACPQLADPRRAAGSSPCRWTWPREGGGTPTERAWARHRRQHGPLPTAASWPGSPSPSTRRHLVLPGILQYYTSPLPGRVSPLFAGGWGLQSPPQPSTLLLVSQQCPSAGAMHVQSPGQLRCLEVSGLANTYFST